MKTTEISFYLSAQDIDTQTTCITKEACTSVVSEDLVNSLVLWVRQYLHQLNISNPCVKSRIQYLSYY